MSKLDCDYPIELEATGSTDDRVRITYKNVFLGGWTDKHRYIRTKKLSERVQYSGEVVERLLKKSGFVFQPGHSGWYRAELGNKTGQEAVINYFCKLIDAG